MGVPVADGEVAGAEEAGQDADVRGVARGKDESRFPPVEGGHDVFEIAKPPARPGEERGARSSGARFVEGLAGSGRHARVEVKAEVAVRVEADEPLRLRREGVADDDLVIERGEELEPVLRRVVALGAERVEHRGELAAALEEIARPVLAKPGDRRRNGSGVRFWWRSSRPPGPGLVPPGLAWQGARREPGGWQSAVISRSRWNERTWAIAGPSGRRADDAPFPLRGEGPYPIGEGGEGAGPVISAPRRRRARRGCARTTRPTSGRRA